MYAALTDMRSRFEDAELIMLSDQAQAGVMDTGVIDSAIADATAEIDSYLARQYALPLPSTPEVLVRTCADMARYNLFSRKAQMPDAVKDAYNRAVAWLKQLATGVVKLEIAGAEPSAPPSDVVFSGPERVFSRDSLGGF